MHTSDVSSRQHLWSANRRQLVVPRHRRSKFGRRSLSVAAPMVWNSFPDSLWDPTLSIDNFRSTKRLTCSRRNGTRSALVATRNALYKSTATTTTTTTTNREYLIIINECTHARSEQLRLDIKVWRSMLQTDHQLLAQECQLQTSTIGRLSLLLTNKCQLASTGFVDNIWGGFPDFPGPYMG